MRRAISIVLSLGLLMVIAGTPLMAGQSVWGTAEDGNFSTTTPGQIVTIDEKLSPVSADVLLIEDSADNNAKKRIQIGNIPQAGGAPTSAQYWTNQAEAGLAAEVVVNSLSSLNTALGGTSIADGAHTTSASDLTTGTVPVALVGAAHIDAITEVAAALKSGGATGTKFVTSLGGAGATASLAVYDANGNFVPSGVSLIDLASKSATNVFTGTGDYGGATLEIPNATSCTSVTGLGRVCLDSDDDVFSIGDGAALLTYRAIGQEIALGDLPSTATTDADETKHVINNWSHLSPFGDTYKNGVEWDAEITSVQAIAAGTDCAITIDIQECDQNLANCSGANGNGIGFSVSLTGAQTVKYEDTAASITDVNIDAGDTFFVDMGTPSGTCDQIEVTIYGKRAVVVP